MDERFIGGLRFFRPGTTTPRLRSAFWALSATYPLAELLVDEQRVLLRLRWAWARRVFGFASLLGRDTTWEAPRASVSAEESKGWMSPGVLLRSPGLPPAIFWCGGQTQRAVLAMLRAQPAS